MGEEFEKKGMEEWGRSGRHTVEDFVLAHTILVPVATEADDN